MKTFQCYELLNFNLIDVKEFFVTVTTPLHTMPLTDISASQKVCDSMLDKELKKRSNNRMVFILTNTSISNLYDCHS